MGYRELLPKADYIADRLNKAGLTREQQQETFEAFAHLINEYSDFHQNEYERVGEKQDLGAQEALSDLALMFESEARYSTAEEG